MGQVVGIDLGTTNTLAALYTDQGPKIIPNLSGEDHLPSAVSLHPTEGLVLGKAARDSAQLRPNETILSVKRHMGTDRRFLFGAQELSPQAISALILKDLKRSAEAHLQRPVDRAVISVPAYFNEVQRRATREAGELAGLKVERLISEPTAAALAFGVERLDTEQSIVVYDLGGGTFDVSVLEMFEGIFSVRACGGDSRLGGDDFDECLYQWLTILAGEQLGRREVAPEARGLFRLSVERAKIDLTEQESTAIHLADLPLADGTVSSVDIEITQKDFEKRCQGLLDRTGRHVRKVLGEAGLNTESVGDVLLIGGSTRMPMVARYLTEMFGRPPKTSVDPMQAVALGAAVQAHLLAENTSLSDVVVTDVSPFTLGVSMVSIFDGVYRPGIFQPLIHRNSSLPARKTEQFHTTAPTQDSVVVEVYQGDDPLVENNVFVDRYHLGGVPADTGETQPIDITFEYDEDGILHVDALICSTGKSAGIQIDSSKMSAVGAQSLACRAHVERLWTESRTTRQLRDLIPRAERLASTLPPEARLGLERRIRAALEALESGDAEAKSSLVAELEARLEREPHD